MGKGSGRRPALVPEADANLARVFPPRPRVRYSPPGFCPECGRFVDGSEWNGKCTSCEPKDT